jgi:segregation and condensation protein B
MEAALYAAGRPLSVAELGKAAGISSSKKILQVARKLMESVNITFAAIQMIELDGERFVLQLGNEFTAQARKFSSRPLLSRAELKTLSYVVYFQPISGKELAERRGPNSYQHIRTLAQLGFLKGEPSGRTRIFKTTTTFSDYFGISNDPQLIKQQLAKLGFKQPLPAVQPS